MITKSKLSSRHNGNISFELYPHTIPSIMAATIMVHNISFPNYTTTLFHAMDQKKLESLSIGLFINFRPQKILIFSFCFWFFFVSRRISLTKIALFQHEPASLDPTFGKEVTCICCGTFSRGINKYRVLEKFPRGQEAAL